MHQGPLDDTVDFIMSRKLKIIAAAVSIPALLFLIIVIIAVSLTSTGTKNDSKSRQDGTFRDQQIQTKETGKNVFMIALKILYFEIDKAVKVTTFFCYSRFPKFYRTP